MHEFVQHNKPFIQVAAVVGVYGLRKAVFNSLMTVTHRSHTVKICETEEEALEFLATYQEPEK